MFYVGMLSYVSVSLQGEGGGFRIQAIFEDTHAMVNTDAASSYYIILYYILYYIIYLYISPI